LTRPTVVYSCVTDQSPLFAHQTTIWASTLLTYGGQRADSVVVHAVESCNSGLAQFLGTLGVKPVLVPPFDGRHPHSNKLVQLESSRLASADYVVLCDCDIAFCGDISGSISGDTLRARRVGVANLTLEQWSRLYAEAGLERPGETVAAVLDGRPTMPTYCNGGLLIVPNEAFRLLTRAWPMWNRWLLERLSLLSPFEYFTDQVSLALACAELELEVDELPLDLNCPTQVQLDRHVTAGLQPMVLHYHEHLDRAGLLLPSGTPTIDHHINRVNDLVRSMRRNYFDNQLFWEFRYAFFPEAGSGVGSRGDNLRAKRAWLAGELRALEPISILDIGCGDLEVSQELECQSYIGVDVSDRAIALARAKRPDWDFVVGDARDVTLAAADLVLCLDVLIHQPTRDLYESLCLRLMELADRHLIVAGYNQRPWLTSATTSYHEPLTATLQRLGETGELRIVGGYRDITLVCWSRSRHGV